MALSKSRRMQIMLVIDAIFFLVEIIIGYSQHSLALVADAFHMLNDILSLCVGLWAVHVAQQKQASKKFTYGWQRAETLGALFNGIFLLALCVSIFLDAVQRFFEPQHVQRPMLILIVGSIGLVFNIGGMFLFHDHGHGHGHGKEETSEHTHETDPLVIAEEGQQVNAVGNHTKLVSDESGNVADVLPQALIGGWPKSNRLKEAARDSMSSTRDAGSKDFTSHDAEESTLATDQSTSPISLPRSSPSKRRHTRSGSRSMFASVDNIHPHPASFRKDIIAAGRYSEESSPQSSSYGDCKADDGDDAKEDTPLLGHTQSNGSAKKSQRRSSGLRLCHTQSNGSAKKSKRRLSGLQDSDELHEGHHHCQSRSKPDSHGHSHSDLNMRGVLLHVIGDALGNVGVIISALIIWFARGNWRFYSDPFISLVITAIILTSAIPLCKATARILLQAVPSHISVDEITEDIEDLEGVANCHHLHVWQLSDAKVVASLHVQLDFDFEGGGSARYMQLARAVRRCLHEYGIHSSTIQPEFCLDNSHQHAPSAGPDHGDLGNGNPKPGGSSKRGSGVSSPRGETHGCLLGCEENCASGEQCCPTPGASTSS